MATAVRAILYRILGNDLPPRYVAGQTLAQLRFLLEYEPEFPGLEKRWLLNRIVCDDTRQACRDLLLQAGQPVEEIAYCEQEYRQVWTDLGDTPDDWHPWNPGFDELHPFDQSRTLEYIARNKNLYLMNNNAARNLAIERGLADAAWVLPWDGGCFLPLQAWQVLQPLLERADLSYLAVPMMRLAHNGQALAGEPPDDLPWDEPQLCFSRQAQQHFDPQLRYGSMPKAMLLRRLAVPGPWLEWNAGTLPWEQPDETPVPDRHALAQAGWVFRLSAEGQGEAHRDLEALQALRFDGIRLFTRQVDRAAMRLWLEKHPVRCLDVLGATAQRSEPEQSLPSWGALPAGQLCRLALISEREPASEEKIHASKLVHYWFIDPATALHPGDLATIGAHDEPVVISSLVGLGSLLDALSVLRESAWLLEGEQKQLESWAEQSLNALATQQRDFLWNCRDDKRAIWYHYLLLVLGCYLGRVGLCCQAIDNVPAIIRDCMCAEGLDLRGGGFEMGEMSSAWSALDVICRRLGRQIGVGGERYAFARNDQAKRGQAAASSLWTA